MFFTTCNTSAGPARLAFAHPSPPILSRRTRITSPTFTSTVLKSWRSVTSTCVAPGAGRKVDLIGLGKPPVLFVGPTGTNTSVVAGRGDPWTPLSVHPHADSASTATTMLVLTGPRRQTRHLKTPLSDFDIHPSGCHRGLASGRQRSCHQRSAHKGRRPRRAASSSHAIHSWYQGPSRLLHTRALQSS